MRRKVSLRCRSTRRRLDASNFFDAVSATCAQGAHVRAGGGPLAARAIMAVLQRVATRSGVVQSSRALLASLLAVFVLVLTHIALVALVLRNLIVFRACTARLARSFGALAYIGVECALRTIVAVVLRLQLLVLALRTFFAVFVVILAVVRVVTAGWAKFAFRLANLICKSASRARLAMNGEPIDITVLTCQAWLAHVRVVIHEETLAALRLAFLRFLCGGTSLAAELHVLLDVTAACLRARAARLCARAPATPVFYDAVHRAALLVARRSLTIVFTRFTAVFRVNIDAARTIVRARTTSFRARPVDPPRAPVALHTVDRAGMLVTVLHLAPFEIIAFYSSAPRLVIDLSCARL